MVWCSFALLCKQETIPAIASTAIRKSRFFDKIHMTVSGGPGGSGFPKIMGVGGQGGNVYLKVHPEASLTRVLNEFPERRIKGGAGGNSARHTLLGQNGADVTVKVPPGITVVGEGNKVLADLVKPGEKVLVAKGGEGGNSKNSYCGRKGEHLQISLVLKLIADIGFVGFPNAGKSTLLRALSRARPTVANYPFTTIKPNIGVVEYPDSRQISLADLPGLIEGAHKNVGLGHSFLRHVERTSLLLFVVDIGGFRLGPASTERNAFETVMSLNKELELYREDLLLKPALLVVNKIDTEGATEKLAALRQHLESDESYENLSEEIKPSKRIKFRETIDVAAREMHNIDELKGALRRHLDELFEEKLASQAAEPDPIPPLELERQLI